MFQQGVCDLCHSPESETLVQLALGRSMLSHQVVCDQNLFKLRCARCGLCRNAMSLGDLSAFYSEDYVPAGDHVFYTSEGPLARSEVFRDWMLALTGTSPWTGRALEVGAGVGGLMKALSETLPELELEGIEPARAAAEQARAKGMKVKASSLEDWSGAEYDVVYSVAVMEHVPSPTSFLQQIWDKLKPGGWLVLVLPTQDVPSYDLFFVDHLYHFGSKHIRELARKAGFRETGLSVGHPLMPNFAAHVLRKTRRPEQYEWDGFPGSTCCQQAAQGLGQDLERLNRLLDQLKGSRIGVFGVHEAFQLLRTYSELWDAELVCGLADATVEGLPFPVVRPEQAPPLDHLLLTLNQCHYPLVKRRLADFPARLHEVFSSLGSVF